MKVTKTLALAGLLASIGAFQANAANIICVAKSTGKFNTLPAAAEAASLVGALSGRARFTVFSTTDEVIAGLREGKVENLLKRKTQDKLPSIVKCHVLPRKLTAGMRPHKTIPVKSLNTSGRLHVTKLASGVIHVIDKVPLAK